MFKLNKTITAVAVCSSLILSASSFAKPEHGKHHNAMKKVFAQLSISDTQKQDIKQVMQQAKSEHQVSAPDMENFRQELTALIHAANWDQGAVEALLASQQSQRAEAGLRKAQNKHAVWNLLTEEQQTKFVTIIAEHKADAEAGEGKQWKKSKKGKIAKRLGLDEAQKAEMADIKNQAKENTTELKANLKSFKQAERALIHSAEFNADAWNSLQQQHQADFLAMAVLQAKTKHQMWNILNTEQQAKMQKMQHRMKGNKGTEKGQKGGKHGQKRNAEEA